MPVVCDVGHERAIMLGKGQLPLALLLKGNAKMFGKLLIAGCAALALSGCVTPEEQAQLEVQAKVADDADCRSYGAQVGTDTYVACRIIKQQQRTQIQIAQQQENQRQLNCGLRRIGASFGTAEQQYANTMAAAAAGC
jgi:hypothetical protein